VTQRSERAGGQSGFSPAALALADTLADADALALADADAVALADADALALADALAGRG